MRARAIILILIFIGTLVSSGNVLGINAYKKELIVGILSFVLINSLAVTIFKFRKYVFLQTKFDWIFRLTNLLVGIVALVLLIYYWNYFYEFSWYFLIFIILGLINGIAYQNYIQLCVEKSSLIVKYKHREKSIIKDVESVRLEFDRILIKAGVRIIEINDLKNTEKNKLVLSKFFKTNFPQIDVKLGQ